MLITKNCLNCDKEFQTTKREINKGYGKFCCRSCSATYNNIMYPKRKYTNKCKMCGKLIKSIRTYCKECYIEKKQSKPKIKKLKPKSKPTTNCKHCKKDFKPKNKAVYCSRNCVNIHRKLLRYKKNEDRGYFYTRDNNPSSRPIRNYLIYKHGNKCMICGQSGENWQDKPLTLIVDHIDGDAHNWKIDNIRIICPNCDSQLPTFKARNKGKSTRKYTITQK